MGDMTLNDFRWQLENIGKHADGKNVQIITDKIDEVRVKIYTDNNLYQIVGKSKGDHGYMGCTASSRKPRAGEDWTRGSDLADGKLTMETWNKIIGDIVAYELVDIHITKAKNLQGETVEVEGAAKTL